MPAHYTHLRPIDLASEGGKPVPLKGAQLIRCECGYEALGSDNFCPNCGRNLTQKDISTATVRTIIENQELLEELSKQLYVRQFVERKLREDIAQIGPVDDETFEEMGRGYTRTALQMWNLQHSDPTKIDKEREN
jgi:hypothetical protein